MALDRGDCPTIAYASQARRAPSSCVLLLLYMSMLCSVSRALLARPASLGRGLVTAAPLRRCLLASTCRTLQCRYRRSTTPPRTHGAWNAAAVSLAGLGRGASSTTTRARFPPASFRRPSPLVAGTCLFFLSFFLPARPPLSGTGVLPQDVSRRGLPWRGAPLVPLPRLINCRGFHVLCPRVRCSTLRVVG